jgi:hypothetical protein
MIEANVASREEKDKRLNFWLALFLGILTCGLYSIYVLYCLIRRNEQHIDRSYHLVEDARNLLREEAEAKTLAIKDEIVRVEMAIREKIEKKEAVLWTVLSLFVPLAGLYVYYFLHKDLRTHETQEKAFFDSVSAIFGKLQKPLLVFEPTTPERNFWLYLVLTLVTCGLFGIYWWYVLIEDGNRHLDEHAKAEDVLLTNLKGL